MLFEDAIHAFYCNRDPEKAVQMAAYMKNQFPFLGLSKPKRVTLQKEAIKKAKKLADVDWEGVFALWNLPEREFQYLAMDYLQASSGSIQQADLDHVYNLITARSWWDTVDMLASSIVGPLCAKNPDLKESHIKEWAYSDNFWLVRTAILFQLKYKEKTDTALLSSIIAANSGTREFFINKAIGWILREYSKTDPAWVRVFLEQHSLHSLSVREASKYI